jgi:uncharacterized protein
VDDASTVTPLARLVLIGLVAGLFSALFGVGGGIVVVPLLIAACRFDAKVATATSLAGIVITAIVGAIAHGVLGNVDLMHALAIGLPATMGVVAGVALKSRLSSRTLVYGFSALLAVAAIRMLFPGGASLDGLSLGVEIPLVAALGFAAGVIAALFGVGGGILFVPLLTLILGLSQKSATGTSLLAMIPVSLLGTWRQRDSGHIRWRDALILGASSTATAVGGALIADVAAPRVVRVLFAALLIFTAVQLASRARQQP